MCKIESVCVSVVRPIENRCRKLNSYYGILKVNLNYLIATYTKSVQTLKSLHFKLFKACNYFAFIHHHSGFSIRIPKHSMG